MLALGHGRSPLPLLGSPGPFPGFPDKSPVCPCSGEGGWGWAGAQGSPDSPRVPVGWLLAVPGPQVPVGVREQTLLDKAEWGCLVDGGKPLPSQCRCTPESPCEPSCTPLPCSARVMPPWSWDSWALFLHQPLIHCMASKGPCPALGSLPAPLHAQAGCYPLPEASTKGSERPGKKAGGSETAPRPGAG